MAKLFFCPISVSFENPRINVGPVNHTIIANTSFIVEANPIAAKTAP